MENRIVSLLYTSPESWHKDYIQKSFLSFRSLDRFKNSVTFFLTEKPISWIIYNTRITTVL